MGLLTFLKNLFHPKKSKKNITKQSKKSQRTQSKKLRKPVNPEDYKASIENMIREFEKNKVFSTDSSNSIQIKPVYITRNINHILDFVNSCQDDVKEKVLKALKTTKKTDKALFLTSVNEEETLYVILMTVNTMPDEECLVLVYSPDLDSVAFFLSELTDLSPQSVKDQFK